MMQSIEIQAVTQARASGDYHPGNDQWMIGLSSIFAHAIGVKPTKDNFWSTPGEIGRYGNDTEPYNRLQAVVSTLSTGPVAPSDAVNSSDVALILRSCAANGLLLQPDRPAVLSSVSMYARAGLLVGDKNGEVWVTKSTIAGESFHYVLAVRSEARDFSVGELAGDTALASTMVAWESNSTSTLHEFDATHPLSLPKTDKYTFNLWTAAPVLSNGYVFMGEATTKWVSASRDRFSDLVVYPDQIYVTANGAENETIEISFAPPVSAAGLVESRVVKTFSCTFGESGSLKIAIPALSGGTYCL